jgi:hypothetical protein
MICTSHQYYTSDQIKKNETGRICGTCGDEDRYTLGFGQQTKEMRPFRKLSRRWENNIKKDIKEIRWEAVNWTDVTQDRNSRPAVVKTLMTLPFA